MVTIRKGHSLLKSYPGKNIEESDTDADILGG
jgi:hypothetical protein